MPADQEVHNGAEGLGTSFDAAGDDDGAGRIVQLVKIVRSSDGQRTPIGADSSGLDVDVVRTPKGTTSFTDPAPTTSITLVLAANSSRKVAMIQNVGAVDVYLGPSDVTTATGFLLEAGASIVDDLSTSAWYGRTAAGTADLRVCEVA